MGPILAVSVFAITLHGGLGAGDFVSTQRIYNRFGQTNTVESNPLMRGTVGTRVGLTLASTWGALYLDKYFTDRVNRHQPHGKRDLWLYRGAHIVIRGLIIGNNLRLYNRASRARERNGVK